MHMRIYEKRPDVNAVVHAHPIYATAFAIAGIPLEEPIMPEAVLLSAYHKLESVEFYAELLYRSKMLGGPQLLNEEQVEHLYEIRRQMNLPGKHPATNAVTPNPKTTCKEV